MSLKFEEVRKRAGLTQQQLADKVGITRGYLNEIENGKRDNISLKVAHAIAEALGVQLKDLL